MTNRRPTPSPKAEETDVKNESHLEFFVDRSAETVERTLLIVRQLQKEIKNLKDDLAKAENEYKNLSDEILNHRDLDD